MLGKIPIGAAQEAIATYDAIASRVCEVCDLVKKCFSFHKYKDGRRCPLDGESEYVARHGIIYPYHGWSIDKNEFVHVPAWDGYDGENFDNAEFKFPFEWLNESDENIVKMVKDGV